METTETGKMKNITTIHVKEGATLNLNFGNQKTMNVTGCTNFAMGDSANYIVNN